MSDSQSLLDVYLATAKGEVTDTLSEAPVIVEALSLPEELPLEVQKWIKIRKVAVAFVDMVNSSAIDFANHPVTSAAIYETFTGTLVDTMFLFGADYIDVKGDGVFAVFVGESAVARAFVATESFRTATARYIKPAIVDKTKNKVVVQCRAGISYGKTIVKRIGRRGRRNNEVWAYRTVNETAKLCGLAEPGKLVMGERAFAEIDSCEEITHSCGCTKDGYTGDKSPLWRPLSEERLANSGITGAVELESMWCKNHGSEYLDKILSLYDIALPKIADLIDD